MSEATNLSCYSIIDPENPMISQQQNIRAAYRIFDKSTDLHCADQTEELLILVSVMFHSRYVSSVKENIWLKFASVLWQSVLKVMQRGSSGKESKLSGCFQGGNTVTRGGVMATLQQYHETRDGEDL